MIKAVFIDFDGTLFSHTTNRIPSSAVEAIYLLQKNGVKVFLCSGRAQVEMKDFDLHAIHFDGFIYNNGQLVLDENCKKILSISIDGELKERILDAFNNKKLPMYLATENDLYLNHIDDRVIECQRKINSPIPHIKEYKGEDFYMASAFGSEEEMDSFGFREYGEVTYWQEGAIDICAKNVSKITGVKAMLEHFNLDMSQAMGVGDGHNDLELLQVCEIGVCMGNGKDEIKNISDYVTTDIDDDGLYNACKHYGLI